MRTFIVLSLLASSALSMAQGLPALYAPERSVADQGINLVGWGSGTISESDDVSFEGTHSVRISSRNYFQGGIIRFAQPVNVATAMASKESLLRMSVYVSEVKLSGGGPSGGPTMGGGGGRPGGMGASGGGSQQGGSGEEGREGGSRPGGGGGGGTTTTPSESISNIRVIITTTDGKMSEAYVPLLTSRPNDKGWRTIGIPLQAIAGLTKSNGAIQSVAFGGDVVSTFYIGELKVTSDSTPIYGEPSFREMNVGSGTTVTFTATGFGGSSILKYAWDFDASNGISVDAEGQAVKRRFRKPGTYTVTLTISDYFGLKDPYKTTCTVTVN